MCRAFLIPSFLFLLTSLHVMAESPKTTEPQVEVRKAVVTPTVPEPTTPEVKPAPVPTPAPATTPPAPSLVPQATKVVFTRCEIQQPTIALTFDDGPHPDFTPRLLDILKQAGIKVTFFMVGRCVVTYPQIVKRMVDEGHEVANHSWSHPLLTELGQTSVESQLRRTHDAIVKACGVVPAYYRPPYGEIRLSQRKRIQDTFGYCTILWDVDPLDWQPPRNSQKVHDRILEQTRAGSIILCHDIHETTVDAMTTTIADLKAKGFQFATVSQLIQLEAQTPPVAGSTSPVEPTFRALRALPVDDEPLPLVPPGEVKK